MAKKTKKDDRKSSDLNHLLIDEKNGWLRIDQRAKKPLERFCNDYRTFLTNAKTEREVNDKGIALAESHGYRDFHEYIKKGTALRAGDKLYYSIRGKTLLLFRIGKSDICNGLRIIGGHSDSPRLDLKPRPLYEDSGLAFFDTHYYGGIKYYQWVTIPLALHGVVTKKNGDRISIVIGESEDDPVFAITDLLPHLGKDQAKKKLNEGITGEGLNVLAGSIPRDNGASADAKNVKLNILRYLHEKYGIDEYDLTSAELEFVPAGPSRDLGIDRSMILGYGHDDRVSVYTGMRALLDLKATPEHTGICVLTDKEEIGSVGSTGMYSFLFENAVAEIVQLAGGSYSELALRRCLRNSKMLSADVNVLHDPNFPDVSSPNSNMAKMNHGVILTKYVGSRGKAGSNDASSEYMAELRKIFDNAGVIWQTGEIGKVDQGGGGTIAFMLARYEMDVVDCGVGVLSMHAPWEAVGKLDIYMAYQGYQAFYRSGGLANKA